MGWATSHIARLKLGETIQFRPKGNSMTGKVNNNQLCTVEPLKDNSVLEKGDIVLCKVGGNQYLHLISAKDSHRYQISNNKGHVNGWVNINCIYGKLIKVEN
jgi:hypothetical protein